MKFDGLNFTKSNTLLARPSKKGDKYLDGTQIDEHYMVVVKASDCEVVGYDELERIKTLRPNDAPSIKDIRSHSMTNKIFGDWKLRKSANSTWVFNLDTRLNELAEEYYQMTVYLVLKGVVYKATLKRAISPKQILIVKNN